MDTESQDNLLKVLHCIDSKSRYGYALLGMGKEFRMQCINADCIEEGIKRRIEKDLDILGVEIIDKKELRSTDTQYTYQNSTPVWKTIHCKLLGCFGKCRILIPSLQCLTEEPDSNYKEKATPKETKENLNELDILIRLHYRGPHDYIAQLFVHQLIPIPILYIVEAKGENLYTHLMEIRNRKMKILSIPSLLNIFLEAVKAVQFVHDKAIIHRDLTTRSFEIYDTSSSERMSIKLSSFKIAKLLWQEGEPVQRETIDRSCDQIPTLWSSPESHKSGVYGKMSDNWTVALLGYEMFNHGAWPYWIEEDISYDDVITQIIFHERPPSQPKNMPDPVCRILQKTLMSKPNDRKKLEEIEEEIVTIMQSMSLLKQKNYTQYKELEDIWASSELPPITREQESMSSNIKRGTPKEILEYRKEFGEPEQLYDSYTAFCDLQTGKRIVVVRENDITSEFKTTRTLRDGTLEVIEQVSQKFSSKDREHLKTLNKDALSIISEIWPPDVRFPENKDTVMYECPSGTSLFKIVMDAYFGDTIDGYIPILHNLACLLKYLHDNSWTANCLRARNVYINDDYLNNFVERDLKVFIPNLGYFTKNADSSGLYDFACAERDIALTYWTTLPVARFIDAPAHGISTKNSICSDYRWTASNSAHVHASGRLDLVVGQAPEVIASSMFSPFSDVFSFSRLLSEICVILDITRKKTSHRYSAARIELKSVPCGNIERNNILRYINNGKIPKKHDSCSDWLWDDVMVPSLSIQRFERPTMADIIEIIEKHSKGLQRPMFSLTEETLVKQVFNQVPYAVAKKGYKRPKSVRREASTLYTRSSGSEPDSKQQNTMSSSGYAQVSEAKHYQNVSESSPTMRK